MKLEFYWQIFDKYSYITYNEIRPVESELFHADTHDKANSPFSPFCELAYKRLILTHYKTFYVYWGFL
jgi:hypothetical protein